jgi:oxygen-dependent protoporphyrinogen oxidase
VGELARTLAERLRAEGVSLRCGVAARAVARSEGATSSPGARGATRVTLADGSAVEADALLLAVPPRVAAGLLSGLDGDVARGLSAIPHGSTATVFLAYRASEVKHPLDGVGFVVPRVLGRPLLAGTWVSSKWADRAPPGHVLVRGFVGGPAGEALLARDDAALAALVRQELRALMQLEAEPLFSRVFRFDHGRPQMRVGHLARMRALHEALARTAPAVRMAGDGYDGASIPDCVRQGREVGRAMVDRDLS